MSSQAANLSFERWSDLSARSRDLSQEDLLDLLEAEEVSWDDFEQSGTVHLLAIVDGLNAGDSTMADAHARRACASTSQSDAAVEGSPTALITAPHPSLLEISESAAALAVIAPPLVVSPSYLVSPSQELPRRSSSAGSADRQAKPGPAYPEVVPTTAAPAPSPFEADETLPIPAPLVQRPAVPFSGSLSPAQVASMFSPVETKVRPEEPGAGETAMMPIVAFVPPKTGTFRDQLGALVVPLLSLDEYSELRARLTVFGETHAPTLARFGVASKGAREALALRFAEYFQRDPAAQERFLAALEPAIARARAERNK